MRAKLLNGLVDEEHVERKETVTSGVCRKGTFANVPVYVKPVFEQCHLPGGLHYVCVRKPGRIVPITVDMDRDDYVSKDMGRCLYGKRKIRKKYLRAY